MNHKDTKKIFANWKHNITNRLDEMFVSKLSEKSQDEDDAKDKKDNKVLLGEEEPEELDEISPIPTPTPQEEESDLDEEYDPEKADIDNDGKVSDWEEAKGKAAFGESEDNLEEEQYPPLKVGQSPGGPGRSKEEQELVQSRVDAATTDMPPVQAPIDPPRGSREAKALGKAAKSVDWWTSKDKGEGDFQESMRSKIREAIKKVLTERKLVEPTHSPKELDSTLTQLKESLEDSRMKSRFKKLID